MTWAIGACDQIGGYAVVFSDIQVKTKDERTFDVLRKAYPVGRNLIGAFAGSVRIGFDLLASIGEYCHLEDNEPGAWAPNIVAEHWAPIARSTFQKYPPEERKLGAEILIVGPHPNEDGVPGQAIPYLCKLRWPDFLPEIKRNGDSVLHIGKGAHIPHYVQCVSEALDPRNGMLTAGFRWRGRWANIMGIAIADTLEKHPVAGISSHIHIHVAHRDGFQIGTSDRIEHASDGTRTVFAMPKVAESWEQLKRMMSDSGANLERAIA